MPNFGAEIMTGRDYVEISFDTPFTDGICRALWIKTAGDLAWVNADGDTRTTFVFPGMFPAQVVEVKSSGTTILATEIRAVY